MFRSNPRDVGFGLVGWLARFHQIAGRCCPSPALVMPLTISKPPLGNLTLHSSQADTRALLIEVTPKEPISDPIAGDGALYSVDLDHAALVTLTIFLLWCYISLRYARIRQDARIEAFLMHQVIDIETGLPTPQPKPPQKAGVSQDEIDQSLCSYSMSSSLRCGHTHPNLKILSCTVCGVSKEMQFTDAVESCSICLSDLADTTGDDVNEGIRVLPICGHMFHGTCIDAWLRRNKKCPLCSSPGF